MIVPVTVEDLAAMNRKIDDLQAVVDATVKGLGLKRGNVTPADVKEVIAGLQAEAELYRRGFHLIGACDIGNYLARCAHGGETMEI